MTPKEAAREIAKLGHGRDKILAHVNPEEAALLARLNGGTINPVTGLLQFGWLQDIGSEFSIRRPFQLVSDPHKFAETEMTKSFQSHVGPAALQFIPGVGPYASMAAKLWLQHEARKGVYGGKTGQIPIQSHGASGATIGSTAGSMIGSNWGPVGGYLGGMLGGMIGGGGQSGAAPATASQVGGEAAAGSIGGGGFGSILGQIFGGQNASGTKAAAKPAAPQQNAQILQLQQQVEALKRQIQAHYAGANDTQQAQDMARVDQWYNEQVQQINQQQQALQQQAAQQ